MPDYSILDYYVNGTTIISNELKELTGTNTIEVIIHRLLSQMVLIYVHISAIPIIYYKSYRLDMEEYEMQWSIIGKETWITLPLLNNWKNYSNTTEYFNSIQYRKENNRIYLRGIVQGGETNSPIVQLPPIYRPQKRKIFTSIFRPTVTGAHIIAQIEVDINGSVYIRNNESDKNYSNIAWVCLDSINFEIE